jgi:hypothetical protein
MRFSNNKGRRRMRAVSTLLLAAASTRRVRNLLVEGLAGLVVPMEVLAALAVEVLAVALVAVVAAVVAALCRGAVRDEAAALVRLLFLRRPDRKTASVVAARISFCPAECLWPAS